ncbi:YraN family protein [Mailhella sp.]|uniref:YraN family protein n=1 Tax=Mailhella sp. TaxID=1981029 RepID=UPI003AB39747
MLSAFDRLRGKQNDGNDACRKTAAKKTGAEGEDAAAAALRAMGWRILARNWRSGHLELDIVAEEGDALVFVEVKTRAERGMQRPFEALTAAKRERLLRAAQAWLAKHDAWGRPCRFDLVCVTSSSGTYQTELIRNVIEYGEQGARHAVGGGNASWQPW